MAWRRPPPPPRAHSLQRRMRSRRRSRRSGVHRAVPPPLIQPPPTRLSYQQRCRSQVSGSEAGAVAGAGLVAAASAFLDSLDATFHAASRRRQHLARRCFAAPARRVWCGVSVGSCGRCGPSGWFSTTIGYFRCCRVRHTSTTRAWTPSSPALTHPPRSLVHRGGLRCTGDKVGCGGWCWSRSWCVRASAETLLANRHACIHIHEYACIYACVRIVLVRWATLGRRM